jgi:hypothetical protein
VAARGAYGRERTRIIGHYARTGTTPDPVGRFDRQHRTETTVVAFALGLLWPFTVLLYAGVRGTVAAVTARPPATASDIERDREHRHRRIRALEEALGMYPDPAQEAAQESPGTGP